MRPASEAAQLHASTAQPSPTPAALLEVEHLTTTFFDGDTAFDAADDVSLSAHRGRTLGIVGESGCGKSVTARSILRLIDPPARIDERSRIVFNGRDLMRCSEREMRSIRGSEIAMIFQEPMSALNPVRTIGSQMKEALDAHTPLSAKEASERSVALLEQVGFPAPARRLGDYPHQLSGGLAQRVLIALALACNPSLLIADEPTTALDVTIQAQILELLGRLRDQSDLSIILITHDFGVIEQLADDVAVMYAGQIVEVGPAARVLEDPQHPYTAALLRSTPVLGVTAHNRRLAVIPGAVPNPAEMPRACRFRDRCPSRMPICAEHEPPRFDLKGRLSKCWLHDPSVLTDEGAARD